MRRITAVLLVGVASAALASAPVAPSVPTSPAPAVERSAVFEPDGLMERDDRDCLQLVPDSASENGVLGGDPVELHVRLVMDLVESRALDATRDDPTTAVNERQRAINNFGRQLVADFLDEGVQSYTAVDIVLDYGSFDVLHTADLRTGPRAETLEGQDAIDLGKAQYGGVRPPGTDLVYVLSDRDLTSGGSSALAGLADCIGGVASPEHAFATGELDRDPTIGLVVADAYVEYTAKVAAHEVGHLMGAHHHYQACGPYAVTNYADGYGIGGCTLMTNFVDFVSFPFSPTNQVVVRGHAENYAAGNDPR